MDCLDPAHVIGLFFVIALQHLEWCLKLVDSDSTYSMACCMEAYLINYIIVLPCMHVHRRAVIAKPPWCNAMFDY